MKRLPFILLLLLALLGAGYWFLSTKPTETSSTEVTPPKEKKAVAKSSPPRRQSPSEGAAPEEFEDDPKGALRLEGQVIDEAGKGVEGAEVAVDSNPTRRAVSGPNGWFAFEEMVGRRYELEARKEGANGRGTVLLSASSLPITIQIERGGTLLVTVLDELDRHPIEGAEVSIGGLSRYKATTDAQGKATLLGLGSWELLAVNAEGYGPYQDIFNSSRDPSSKQEKIVTLSLGAMVSGVVLDPSGAPAAGARVTVESNTNAFGLSSGSGDEDEKIVADEQGRWQVKALSAGTYRFRARHGKFAPGLSEPIPLDGKTPKENIEVRLTEGASLSGKVISQDGSPVPAALISVGRESQDFVNLEPNRKAYADEKGEFLVEGLPRVPSQVVASAEGIYSEIAPVDLSGGAVKDVTLQLAASGTITGVVVTLSGEPVADAEVTAFPEDLMGARSEWRLRGLPRATSDADGVFELRGIAEGKVFTLSASGNALQSSTPWTDAAATKAQAGATGVRLVLKEFGSVKGRVLFEDGTAPSSYEVSAGWESKGSFSNPDGSFELKKVPPGKMKVTVAGPRLMEKTSELFEVKASESTDVGTITIVSGRLITGRVLSQTGAPVAGAAVYAGKNLISSGGKPLDLPGLPVQEEVTKEDGSFELGGLSSEAFYVFAEHPGEGRSNTMKVVEGKEDLTLDLPLLAVGAVEGKVMYKGAPVVASLSLVSKDARGSLTQGKSEADGLFRFDKLAVGAYLLTASRSTSEGPFSQGGSRTVEISISKGQTAKHDIEIPSGVTLTIRPTLSGAAVNNVAAQVFHGVVAATDTKQLEAIAEGLNPDLMHFGMMMDIPMMSTEVITIEDMVPGKYTACLYRLPSFLEVQAGGADMTKKRPALCAPLTIAASPDKQEFSYEAPAE